MRGRAEQGQGGHQGEDREDQQADSIQHDGSKLPVVDDERFLFAGLDCLSDQPGQLTLEQQCSAVEGSGILGRIKNFGGKFAYFGGNFDFMGAFFILAHPVDKIRNH